MLLATDYVTCNSGTWDNPQSGSTILFSADGGPCNISPGSITWATGDRLLIAAGTTLTIIGNVTVTDKAIVVVNSGNVIFDGGKLSFDNAASILRMLPGATLTCTGGCGSNDQLTLGSGGTKHTYNGAELTAINNAPRPTTVNSTTFLPVKLLFFNGVSIESAVQLKWATSSELNFDYFEIERSQDAKDFETIAKIAGNGTTSVRHDYNFKDEDPFIGKNYYRLKSVDFDLYTEYFNLVAVDFSGDKTFFVSPNPSDGRSINFVMNFAPDENSTITVYNSLSNIVKVFTRSEFLQTATLENLKSGVYYAKFVSNGFVKVDRFIVR
jgi:hypothetical protein